jgi:histidinol-phosphatase (PHP family)
MVEAADDSRLSGVGFADHCIVSDDPELERVRAELGASLDVAVERRRQGLASLRERYDVAVYDAVEVDYRPTDEPAIEAFLDRWGFDYAVGSVHRVGGRSVQSVSAFADDSGAELDEYVDRYFDRLVALADSELFEVAAHPDLVERNDHLAGRATREHYERAARAFSRSRTVPEVNAGRALREGGSVSPLPDFLDALREHGVAVTVGTDSHRPGELDERAAFLEEFLAERGIDPVAPEGV